MAANSAEARIVGDEAEQTGGGSAGDRRLRDPPKPVIRVEAPSDLAAKMAKLTEGLAAVDATSAKSAPLRAPPTMITSSSLDEAKTYISGIDPAASAEPITQEMFRVRIADEVDVGKCVTERIDRSAVMAASLGGLAPTEDPAAPAPGVLGDEEASNEDGGALDVRGSPRKARGRAYLVAALVVATIVLVAGYASRVGRTDVAARSPNPGLVSPPKSPPAEPASPARAAEDPALDPNVVKQMLLEYAEEDREPTDPSVGAGGRPTHLSSMTAPQRHKWRDIKQGASTGKGSTPDLAAAPEPSFPQVLLRRKEEKE